MKDRSIDAIKKMIFNIEKVFRYTNCISYDDFIKNDMIVDATIFSIYKIGENVKNIDEQIQHNYPEIMWHVLKGLRNRIVHDYDGINFEFIWFIIKNDLSPLKENLIIILKNLEK